MPQDICMLSDDGPYFLGVSWHTIDLVISEVLHHLSFFVLDAMWTVSSSGPSGVAEI